MKKLGRFTEKELQLISNMYKEGISIYKIGRALKRTQKLVRNNLIRLGLKEGKVILYKNAIDINNKKSSIVSSTLLLITLLFFLIIQLQTNFLELIFAYQILFFMITMCITISITYKFLKNLYKLVFLSLYIYILMM